MGDMMDLIDQHIAYAWSPDGTDRFTKYNVRNLLPTIDSSNDIVKIKQSTWIDKLDKHGNKLVPVKSWEGIVINMQSLVTAGSIYTYSILVTNKTDVDVNFSFYNNGVFSFDTLNKNVIVKAQKTERVYLVFKLNDISATIDSYSRFEATNAPYSGVYQSSPVLVEGDFTGYLSLVSIDYDNAVPRYIGRSLKDSTNPADFKFEPNPERKPWTAYAQGLNGEGLSIYPYNPNIAFGTDATQKKGVFANASVTNGDYAEFTITSKDNYAQISLFDGFSMKPKDYEPGSKVTVSFELMYTNWNVPSNATIQEFNMFQRWTREANYASIWNVYMPRVDGTNVTLNQWIKVSGTYTVPARSSNLESYQEIIQLRSNTAQSTITFRIKADTFKVELGGIPTPWTPAPSEDPLGAIPKYVGTAALPYEDWTKYTWDLNPSWLQQESNNNLANKVDNDTYNNDQSTVWQEISNRVTEEEAQAIQDSLTNVTNAYTDFVSTGGKHDQDLANLKRAINTDIQKLADKVLGFDFVNTWFRIGDGGLSIGEANSNFEILVSNDQITFYDSGTAVAYVSNQSFFINSGMIVDDLQIGKFKMVAINDNLMGLFHIA